MQMTQETWVQSLGREDALEKETATLSSILARKTPRTEESGGPRSMGSQRARHDWTQHSKHVWHCLVFANSQEAKNTKPCFILFSFVSRYS